MSYLKLIGARRKSGDQPTMKPVELTKEQKALAAQGKCIHCGNDNPDGSSYICEVCQGEETIEQIRDDIEALRRKILGPSGDPD